MKRKMFVYIYYYYIYYILLYCCIVVFFKYHSLIIEISRSSTYFNLFTFLGFFELASSV